MNLRLRNDVLVDVANVNALDEFADAGAEAIAFPALNVDCEVAESGAGWLPIIKDTGASVWSHSFLCK